MTKTEQNHTGSGDNVGGDKIINIFTENKKVIITILVVTIATLGVLGYNTFIQEPNYITNLKKVNTINLDGNNNVVIQGVDKSNITVNITVPFEHFVEKYTKEKDKEIANLYQNITELRQLNDYKQTDLRNLQDQIQVLRNQRANLEQQVKDNIKNAKKTDFSRMDGLYQAAYLEFLKGDINKLLQILSKSKLENHEKENYQVAQNRILRAKALNMQFQFEEAEENYKIALEFDRSAENLFNYAYFLQKLKQFKKTITLYEEALSIYRQLAEKNPRTYLPDVAMTLNNFGELHRVQSNFEQAKSMYQEALSIRRQLAEKNPKAYLSDVAMTLNNLAILHQAEGRFSDALKMYQEALSIYRQLAEKNPRAYLPSVAMILNNFGELHRVQNNFEQAKPMYQEALSIRRQLAEKNPRAYLPGVAGTLNNFGELHRVQSNFEQAKSMYQEALSIRRQLAEKNPKAYLSDVAMTLNNFGELYRVQNNFEQAKPMYQEALSIYRQFAEKNPRAYLPYVGTTLNNLAILHKTEGRFRETLKMYQEALSIRRRLAEKNPKVYLPDVAMTVVNLSIFYLEDQPDKQKSIALAEEVLEITERFPQIPVAQKCADTARQVLQAWNDM